MAIRVLIVDDSKPFLEAASVLLEREGLTVAGVASTSGEALRQVEILRPDIILVDVFLGEESGFELARLLVEGRQDGGVGVILISTHEEADFEDLIAASSAAGFLPKAELSAAAIQQIIDAHSSP